MSPEIRRMKSFQKMCNKHYIFRWKDNGICVTPSRSKTKEECWRFAEDCLTPAFGPDKGSTEFVRKFGEVIEDDE